MIMEKSFGIIPLRENQRNWEVLLVQHLNGGHWGFPKGHASFQEEAKQAAARELKEEVNLQIEKFLPMEPFSEEYQFLKEGKLISKQVLYFPALVFGKLQFQAIEIQTGEWLTLHEAIEYATFDGAKSILSKLIRFLEINKKEPSGDLST